MSEQGVELRAQSLAATHEIAAVVAAAARVGDVILLVGDMGSGKTAFAQGFGRAVGVTEPITSPTFTLVHSYDLPDGRVRLHHADLYRLERTAEIADLSLLELAEDRGIVLVEWGEVADQLLGDHLMVVLERDDAEQEAAETGGDEGEEIDFGLDESRSITVSAAGAGWAARWSALVDALGAHRC